MQSISKLLNRRNILSSPAFIIAFRQTSAGPPPPTPAKEGSLTYRYEQFIGKWPKVLALHRTVLEGSRWCFSDVKIYFKTRRAVASGQKKLTDLNSEQLETLVQSGSELFKMLTLIVILQIPGPGDILILMLIFFPRLVLTRHFWSDEQRREFFQLEVTKALISGEQLLKTLGSPTRFDEIKLKSLDQLNTSELLLLHGMHSMYPLPGFKKRMTNRMAALRALDNLLPAVIDEFNERQLVFNCYIRKIDIGKKSESELRDSLREYVKFTSRMPNSVYLYASPLFKQN